MIYFLKSKKWRKNITNKIKNRIQRAITIVVLLSFIFTSTGIPAQATGFGNTVLDDLIIEDNIPSSVLPKDWVDDPILDFSAWEEQSEQVLEAEEVVKLTPSLTIINNSVELEEEALTTLVDEEEEVSAAAGDEGEVVKLVTAPFLYQYDQNESVNLNTGALNVTMTDLTLPGKNGLDLVISRTYDSSDANFFDTYSDGTINSTKLNRRSLKDSNYNCYTGRLASGWRFNFSFMDTDYKRIHLADGRVYSYKKHGGSIYALIDSSRDNASGTQDGLYIYCNTNNDPYASYRSALWTLCYKDGKKEFFDKDGHLIGIQDRFGNTIDFEYSNGADWVTTTITDSVNRVLTISSAVIPSEGLNNDYEVIIRQDQDVLFKYYIEWTGTPEFGSEYCNYFLANTKDRMNRETSYQYQIESGEFSYSPNPGFYYLPLNNHFANLEIITHPSGGQSQFEYEKVTQALQSNYVPGAYEEKYRVKNRKNVSAQGLGYNYLEFTYSYPNFSGLGVIYPYDHYIPKELPDDFTYWTKVTNSDGIVEKHTFNNHHRNTIKEYSQDNKVYEKITTEYKVYTTLPTSVTKFSYTYNSNGTIKDSTSTTELYEYNDVAEVTAYWSPEANGDKTKTDYKKTIEYSVYIWHSAFSKPLPNYSYPKKVTYKQNTVTTIEEVFTYSLDEKTMDKKEVFKNSTKAERTNYTYDAFGNVLTAKQFIDPIGSDTTPNTITTTYTYGNNVALPSALLNVYPTSEAVTAVKDADGSNATYTSGQSAGTIKKFYAYDTYGNLLKSTDGKGTSTDNITIRTYDQLNRLTQIKNPDNSTKNLLYDDTLNTTKITYEDSNEQELYSYDAFGNLKSVKDVKANQVIQTLVYDSNFRVTEENTLIGKTVNAYDARGRLTSVTKKNTAGTELYKESYAYDDVVEGSLNSKITKTVTGDTNAPALITVSYTDKMGRVVQAGRKSGSTEYLDDYTYDYLGNKLTEKTAYSKTLSPVPAYTNKWEYDYAGQVTKHYDPLGNTATITYDGLGRKTSASDYMLHTTNYTYDSLGRLIKEVTPLSSSAANTRKYYYDAADNLTKEAVSKESSTWDTTEYDYNSRNWLNYVKTESTTSGNDYVVYNYDTMGRITKQYTGASSASPTSGTAALTQYTYGWSGADRTVTVTDPMNKQEKSTYDSMKLLKEVQDRNGVITAYTYDGMGRLLTKKAPKAAPTLTSAITYTKTGEIYQETETNSSGSVSLTYKYDALGRMTENSETGNVVKTYNYDIGNHLLDYTLKINGTQQQKTAYAGYDKAGRVKTATEQGGGNTQASYDYDNKDDVSYYTYMDLSANYFYE